MPANPEKYGELLRGDIKRYWKLRVGEIRVIYEIRKEQVVVYIIKAGLRRNEEVYQAVLKTASLTSENPALVSSGPLDCSERRDVALAAETILPLNMTIARPITAAARS